MNGNYGIDKIDVVILCGGLGTRLRLFVSDRPKCMAEIRNRPFLDILMKHLYRNGFRRMILCLGFMGEKVRSYFSNKKLPFDIVFSQEDVPLGTGGALKQARSLIKGNNFMVVNGDSYCPVNFPELVGFHINKKSLLTVVLKKNKKNDGGYGIVDLDKDRRIRSFQEKNLKSNSCYVNTGIYLMNKQIFNFMKMGRKFSLEYDLFPKAIKRDCFGHIAKARLIDIGTPVSLAKAQRLLF